MDALIEKLNENLRVIYRKSVDADAALNQLKQQGKGKFQNIFAANSGFTTSSQRFQPYVEEVAGDVAMLAEASEEKVKEALPSIVKKLELLLTTLSQFQDSLKR